VDAFAFVPIGRCDWPRQVIRKELELIARRANIRVGGGMVCECHEEKTLPQRSSSFLR
jgi:hypothetical protein